MSLQFPILWLGPDLPAVDVGAKASRLGDALGAGLPVPPGFVIPASTQDPFRAALRDSTPEESLPSALRFPWLAEALDALGAPPWVLRTSAPDEDTTERTLAGLYRTELDLATLEAVLAAARSCYAHLEQPSVVGLRRALGGSARTPRVALLVQQQVTPRLAGVLFTRDPLEGASSESLVLEWTEGSTTAVTAGLGACSTRRWRRGCPPHCDPVLAGVTAQLDLLASQAETLLEGGADLEWALTPEGALLLLQLRPITAWAPARPTPQPPGHAASMTPALCGFQWDGEHNPAPLSPLHASVITHLDTHLRLPFRMTVVEGALLTAPRQEPASPPSGPGDLDAHPVAPEEILRWWAHRARPALTHALIPLESGHREDASVLDLLPAFDHFYEIYAGQVGPTLARLRRLVGSRLLEEARAGSLTETLGGIAPPLTRWLRRLATLAPDADLRTWLRRGQAPPDTEPGAVIFEAELQKALAEVGALPLTWDLASPTLAETPALLRQSAARLADTPERPGDAETTARGGPQSDWNRDTSIRQLLHVEEEDDIFFARALLSLRRAALSDGARLLARGQLGAPSEVFQLTLDSLAEALRQPHLRPVLPMVMIPPAPPQGPNDPQAPGILRGVGCGGGVVIGKARRVDSLDAPVETLAAWTGTEPEPRILVIATLVPAAATLLLGAGVAGVVTDHGGILSHGAILARELGIPAVLGTRHATRLVQEGHRLRMDADLGVVLVLGT